MLLTDISYAELHKRYTQQSQWTKPLVRFLLRRFFPERKDLRILEVGFGTGAAARNFRDRGIDPTQIYGIDPDRRALVFSGAENPKIRADGAAVPFASGSFDIVYCQYLLLWAGDPVGILREMDRVCRPGGIIAALAEPDYSLQSIYPPSLRAFAALQRDRLIRAGAEVNAGAMLRKWFSEAGAGEIHCAPYKKGRISIRRETAWIRANVFPENYEFLERRIDQNLIYSAFYIPTYYAYTQKEILAAPDICGK